MVESVRAVAVDLWVQEHHPQTERVPMTYTRETIETPAGAPATCCWLVRVPSYDEAPCCEADRWREVDCGAVVQYDTGGFSCAAGHDHRTYGGPEHTEYFDADERWAAGYSL